MAGILLAATALVTWSRRRASSTDPTWLRVRHIRYRLQHRRGPRDPRGPKFRCSRRHLATRYRIAKHGDDSAPLSPERVPAVLPRPPKDPWRWTPARTALRPRVSYPTRTDSIRQISPHATSRLGLRNFDFLPLDPSEGRMVPVSGAKPGTTLSMRVSVFIDGIALVLPR